MTNQWKISAMIISPSLKRSIQVSIAAGLVAVVATLFMSNYYRSEARLLPVDSKGSGSALGGLASAAAAFGVSVPGGDSNDANYVDVLNSRWLKEKILQSEFQFHVRSWRFGAETAEKKKLYDYLEARNMDQAVRVMGSVLRSSRDIRSKVISISAETTSPELSQQIAQEAIKQLESFSREKGRTRGSAKVAFAEARLVEAREEMNEAESAFRRYLEANKNYQMSGDPNVRLTGARFESELRLRQQLVTSIAMNREQALLEEKNDIPILNILDQGHLPFDKIKPNRISIVALTMLLAGISTFLWSNRKWVHSLLNENGLD